MYICAYKCISVYVFAVCIINIKYNCVTSKLHRQTIGFTTQFRICLQTETTGQMRQRVTSQNMASRDVLLLLFEAMLLASLHVSMHWEQPLSDG